MPFPKYRITANNRAKRLVSQILALPQMAGWEQMPPGDQKELKRAIRETSRVELKLHLRAAHARWNACRTCQRKVGKD